AGSFLLCDGISSQKLTDVGVTQTPRHEVAQKGQTVTLRCQAILSHNALFWYRQTVVQGLELLIFFRNQAPIDDTGMPKDRFSAAMPNASSSTLKIQPTEPRDSAVYLCASSLATVLQNHSVQVQKPWYFPALSPTLSAVVLGSCPILGRTRVWCSAAARHSKNR
uniref:Ig-like domain-containing protein n=1 Tax=Spermophilus dauricus TaxID=99837 RepID=A0A8C9PD10_SPEDA